jgi:DNA-binding phage protein
MLSEQGNPEFKSLQKLLSATGLGLNVVTAEQRRATYKIRGRAIRR